MYHLDEGGTPLVALGFVVSIIILILSHLNQPNNPDVTNKISANIFGLIFALVLRILYEHLYDQLFP